MFCIIVCSQIQVSVYRCEASGFPHAVQRGPQRGAGTAKTAGITGISMIGITGLPCLELRDGFPEPEDFFFLPPSPKQPDPFGPQQEIHPAQQPFTHFPTPPQQQATQAPIPPQHAPKQRAQLAQEPDRQVPHALHGPQQSRGPS